jgi:hypothetical protein
MNQNNLLDVLLPCNWKFPKGVEPQIFNVLQVKGDQVYVPPKEE